MSNPTQTASPRRPLARPGDRGVERDAYSIRELADRYGVNRLTIYREVWDGKLTAFKLRGRLYVSRNAVDAWQNSLKTLTRGYIRGYGAKSGK